MNDLLVILAISVIIIGFLILVGVAIWLAAERRRHLAAGQNTAARQPAAAGEKPAAPPPAMPAAKPAAEAEPKNTAGDASPAGNAPQKDVLHSGEYPSAAIYDQTLLPQPPKRRTRPQSK